MKCGRKSGEMKDELPCLYHFSHKKINKVLNKRHYKWDTDPNSEVYQSLKRIMVPGKPIGFWVSVYNSWADWCGEMGSFQGALKYKYKVNIKKENNLLFINDLYKLDNLCSEYGIDTWGISLPDQKFYSDLKWWELKSKYDGIIISPYQPSRRLFTFFSQWYYGWDCASGCIWNVSCIDGIELLKR